MEKSLDIALRQQMNIEEMSNLGDVPELSRKALYTITQRKKSEVFVAPPLSFLAILYARYKWVSLSLCIICIAFSITFICTFNVNQQSGDMAGTRSDTSLTVSSNTYLATLNQPTVVEAPVITSTALTCISTFKN